MARTYGSGPVTVEVMGLTKLKSNFLKYQKGVLIAGPVIAGKVAENIAEVAKDLAPFDPENTTEPHVRDNINIRKKGMGAEVFVNRGGVRDDVPAYLEFGTYKMAPEPFLHPALNLVLTTFGVQRAARQVGGLLSPKRGGIF